MSEVIAPTINRNANSEIPAEWAFVSVNTIAASVKNAIVGGPFGSDLVSKDYVSDGVPVIRGQNMGEHWLQEPYVFVTEEKAKALEANWARPGDVVFTQRGTLGQVSLVPRQKYERYLVSQSQMKVSLNDSLVDSRYFHYWFSSPPGQAAISQSAIQTGVPHINLGILRSLPLLLPPLAEQVRIALSLSGIDALISSLDQLIAKKRDIQQAAMQQLLTGQRRLPGFSGAWDVKPMRALGNTYGGLTGKTKIDFGHGEARYIPFMNVMTDTVIDASWLEPVDLAPDEAQNLAKKGDLFFNGSSETPEEVGFCSVLLDEIPNLYLNSFCFGFRFNAAAKVNGLFFAYWFRSKAGRTAMSVLAQGATRYNIAKSAFMQLVIPQPSEAEQTAIATILTDIDTEAAALEARREKACQLKQGMMQELLTGRIRLA